MAQHTRVGEQGDPAKKQYQLKEMEVQAMHYSATGAVMSLKFLHDMTTLTIYKQFLYYTDIWRILQIQSYTNDCSTHNIPHNFFAIFSSRFPFGNF